MFKLRFKKKGKKESLFKYTYPLLVVVIILGIGYLGWFLYYNFYQTIAEVNEVFILRQQVAADTVNTKLFNEIMKKYEQKGQEIQIDWEVIKNPFQPYAITIEE